LEFGLLAVLAKEDRIGVDIGGAGVSKAAAALVTWILGLTRAAMPTFSELRGSLGDGDAGVSKEATAV